MECLELRKSGEVWEILLVVRKKWHYQIRNGCCTIVSAQKYDELFLIIWIGFLLVILLFLY